MTNRPTYYLLLAAKLLALTLILIVVSGIGAGLLPVAESPGDAVALAPQMNVLFAIFFLQVLALAIPVLWSRWTGWKLSAAIFIVYYGTTTVVSQIESLIYLDDKMPDGLVAGLFAMGFFVAAVFSPISVLLLGRWKKSSTIDDQPATDLNLGRWGWRVAVAGLVFLSLYYLFGYYYAWQNPDLQTYYGGTDPGSFLAQMQSLFQNTPWLVPMQYLRGLMYVVLGLIVICAMRGSWWRSGLALSLLFAVPTLYLLLPNPVMPEFVRMVHLTETLPYQFAFGWFLAWFVHGKPANAQDSVGTKSTPQSQSMQKTQKAPLARS